MKFDRRDFLKDVSLLGGLAAFSGSCSTESKEASQKDSFKSKLLSCLGGSWPEPCDLKPRVTKTVQKDGYRLKYLDYEVEKGDRVPAILIVPDQVNKKNQAPGITVWHQHNGQWHLGKSEPAGLAGNPEHHTGVALAKLGYVVLCPDALCFEERQDPEKKLKGGRYERYEFLRYLVDGKCMAWKNILDMRSAVDYLASRPEVDSKRMGCYGHSMGSTHTWLVGPWEQRLKVLVANCCLPTYDAIHRTKLLHSFPNFIPGLHAFGDTPDIAALIAPRRFHINLGDQDHGTPIEEAREGIKKIASVYAQSGNSGKFTSFIETGAGHVLSDSMWEKTKQAFSEL